MIGPYLENGRVHDAASQIQAVPIPAGALRLTDVGYWSLDEMNLITEEGGFWLSHLKSRVKIVTQDGKSRDIWIS